MMRRAIITAMFLSVVGCDEYPNNTELCRYVYDALCVRSKECGEYTYLSECRAHYWEECRVMRLQNGANQPTEEGAACVMAIISMDCGDILDPGTLEECSFLVAPPDDGDDAGPGSDADAGGDADADADADADSLDDAGEGED